MEFFTCPPPPAPTVAMLAGGISGRMASLAGLTYQVRSQQTDHPRNLLLNILRGSTGISSCWVSMPPIKAISSPEMSRNAFFLHAGRPGLQGTQVSVHAHVDQSWNDLRISIHRSAGSPACEDFFARSISWRSREQINSLSSSGLREILLGTIEYHLPEEKTVDQLPGFLEAGVGWPPGKNPARGGSRHERSRGVGRTFQENSFPSREIGHIVEERAPEPPAR